MLSTSLYQLPSPVASKALCTCIICVRLVVIEIEELVSLTQDVTVNIFRVSGADKGRQSGVHVGDG